MMVALLVVLTYIQPTIAINRFDFYLPSGE